MEIKQADLDRFKKLFPGDERLQSLTLDQLIKYSHGKDRRGVSAQPSREVGRVAAGAITPCNWAIGVLAIDCVLVLAGLAGIHGKIKPSAVEAVAEAVEPVISEIEEAAELLSRDGASNRDRAWAIWTIGKTIYSAGMLEAVYKAIISDLTWWDMVLYGVIGLAELTAVFLTDGAALVALIAAEMGQVGFAISDGKKVFEACHTGKPPGDSGMPQWTIALPESDKAIIDNVTAAVWGAGNQGRDLWGWDGTDAGVGALSATVEGSTVTLKSSMAASSGDDVVAIVLRYTTTTGTTTEPRVYACMAVTKK